MNAALFKLRQGAKCQDDARVVLAKLLGGNATRAADRVVDSETFIAHFFEDDEVVEPETDYGRERDLAELRYFSAVTPGVQTIAESERPKAGGTGASPGNAAYLAQFIEIHKLPEVAKHDRQGCETTLISLRLKYRGCAHEAAAPCR
jgi:hypothetical protein